jgi:hypothetical protein
MKGKRHEFAVSKAGEYGSKAPTDESVRSSKLKRLKTGTEKDTMTIATKFDQLDYMIRWEQGELDEEETVTLFQNLINTGLAWSLQGCYGRQAASLIEAGLCSW